MSAYYNEFDKGAAQWLRNLISAGLIPAGDVDERSITEVHPDDLRGYTQCHFFAGIGGWSLALAMANWPADRPVWTGSCPCQPYSSAGSGKGNDDERDLWPAFGRLIAQCRPDVVFGEQVERAIKHGWLDRVSADMEREGYAVGHAVLGAHSVGAPHIRQRLYWVADSGGQGLEKRARDAGVQCKAIFTPQRKATERRGFPLGLGDADSDRSPARSEAAAPLGHWGSFDAANCIDGKTRRIPTEPAFQPMVNGLSPDVARLRGYGNAIVPQVAAEFVMAWEDVRRAA